MSSPIPVYNVNDDSKLSRLYSIDNCNQFYKTRTHLSNDSRLTWKDFKNHKKVISSYLDTVKYHLLMTLSFC